MPNHSDLPWKINGPNKREVSCGYVVAKTYGLTSTSEQEQHDNAAFIVRACNSHYDLLAALKELAECSPCQNGCAPDDMTCASNKARVAIAKAQGL